MFPGLLFINLGVSVINFFSSALAGFLVVRFPATTYANDATISICSAPGFAGLRDCTRSCFDRGACGILADAISYWAMLALTYQLMVGSYINNKAYLIWKWAISWFYT
jgi:hypothetical protein